MTSREIEALLNLEARVTRGPWRESSTKEGPDRLKVWAPNPDGIAGFASEVVVLAGNRYIPSETDVLFAARARNVLRALATELLECRRVLVEYHRANDAIWLPEGGARVGTTDAEWQRHDRAEVALDRLAARIAAEDRA